MPLDTRARPCVSTLVRALVPALVLLVAGCASLAPAAESDAAASPPAWPEGLVGDFPLKEVLDLNLAAHDGVALRGAVLVPDVPKGVRAPVLIASSPYWGQCPSNGGLTCRAGASIPPAADSYYDRLVRHGFVVVKASVRGTGTSGGCWQMFGPDEQKDQATLVEWAAKEPWSNGRVGMIGHSYLGTTPWMAALQAPPALKTIVPSGIVSDPYTFTFSPQGAPLAGIGAFWAAFGVSNGVVPPIGGIQSEGLDAEHAARLAERACPDVLEILEPAKSELTDDRNEAFWAKRRLIDGFSNITASVFVVHGLLDNSGHAFQEDEVWGTISAPKRMLVGQWGHVFPPPDEQLPADFYEADLFPWLDHWLKGVGPLPPETGTARFQDSDGEWRSSAAWPPTASREEALFLDAGKLSTAPGSAPSSHLNLVTLCPLEPTMSVFASEPLDAPLVVAGNAFAYLSVESDAPGGTLGVDLFAAKEFSCDLLQGMPPLLASGAADLRFHAGNMRGKDFPTGAATDVRVDLFSLAHRFEPGERLIVVVTHGLNAARTTGGQPYVGGITLLPASHLVLPVLEGSTGGATTGIVYPPRPFVPTEAPGP